MISATLFFRRARALLWTTLSVLIILAATLVGLGKLLMPYSDRFQPRLEAWLAEEFGQKVTLASFEGEWNAFGPRLTLEGLRLQAVAGRSGDIIIESAALDIKPLNALIPGRALYSFLLIGADVRVTRSADDHYVVSGVGIRTAGEPKDASGFRNLIGVGTLNLEDSRLEYRDEKRGIHLNLEHIDALLEASEEQLGFNLRAEGINQGSAQSFGEVEATGIFAVDGDGGFRGGEWQVTFRDVLLSELKGRLPEKAYMPASGTLNGEFWGNWQAGGPLEVSGSVDLADIGIGDTGARAGIARLDALLKWESTGSEEWRIDLSDLQVSDGTESWTAPRVAVARNLPDNVGLWVSADFLPLAMPVRLAREMASVSGIAWPAGLPGAAAGDVTGLDVVLDRDLRPRYGQATLHQAGFGDWDRGPDVSGIDGSFTLANGGADFQLHAGRLQVDWPRVFPEPVAFSIPGCSGNAWWETQLQIDIESCRVLNEDLSLEGEFLLLRNGGRPAMDLNVHFLRGNIGEFARYWPRNLMKENVIAWLERGLVSGQARDGRVQLRGDLDNWPFPGGEGVFEVSVEVRDAELDYAPGWPRARGINVTTRFDGPSLYIDGAIEDVAGNPVQEASAVIADLKSPVLELEYGSESRLDSFAAFLRESPLRQRMSDELARMEFAGPASTTGKLRVGLGKNRGQLELGGSLQLVEGRYSDPESEVTLEKLEGELQYTRQSLSAEGLAAVFKGKRARLGVLWDAQAAESFRAELDGIFDAHDMIPAEVLERFPELEGVRGQSEWSLAVRIPKAEPGVTTTGTLEITSELLGVEINLPDPLRKPAGLAWPFALHYPLGKASRVLDIRLDERVRLQVDLAPTIPDDPGIAGVQRVSVRLGGGAEPLPAKGLLRIAGEAAALDLDGWIDLLSARARRLGNLGELSLGQCAITAQNLTFLDRAFDATDIAITSETPNVRTTFSGEDISGHVLFNPAGSATGSLSAEFERLALAKPIHGGVEMDQDPAQLPTVHLYARSFRYGGIELGETRIEAYPVANGFHFEKVESESPEVTLRASGDWLKGPAGHRSDFNILMTSESLGRLMQSLDISSSLEGGQAVLRVNAWWPGSPAAFAMSRLNGDLEFNVTRGQITNASPGGGRLLGLLSLQALPRRLALDFRDVFDTGFDFDEATGTFRMENGTATTDDVLLTSSAAKISLTGKTDLVMQQYDQVITVRPGVGNTLPVIGAIAGGPGGAAAGIALQGLLQEGLGEATQVQYSITGSWNEPVIEPVVKANADG